MGKFDFEEMDSAMQNAGSKHQYEQQTELLNKNIGLAQELNENLGLYIKQAQNLIKVVRAIIFDIDKASTIKCPTNLKPLLNDYTNEVCIEVLKKMNIEATKIVNRIAAMEKRKTISESLFYILWITAILLFLFFIMVSYLNYNFLQVDKLWNLIFVFGFLISFAIGITIYLCRRDSE